MTCTALSTSALERCPASAKLRLGDELEFEEALVNIVRLSVGASVREWLNKNTAGTSWRVVHSVRRSSHALLPPPSGALLSAY